MAKIETKLERPSHCDACASPNVKLTSNTELYQRITKEFRHIYYCTDCGALVTCHLGTTIPLGRMADRETRRLRQRLHAKFDPIWKSGFMNRKSAYNWLASELGIAKENCHISWLGSEHLIIAIDVCVLFSNEKHMIMARRKARKDERTSKRNDREHKRRYRYT